MDNRTLRYFIAVFECGSISAASRRCHVAQPSISAAIRQLESRLGVTLFERHRQGITATEEGHRLYPLATRLHEDLQAIQRLFQQPTPATPVRLGLMRSLGARRMSRLLKEYIAAGDNLALTLVNPEESCDARIVSEAEREPHEAFQPVWHDAYLLALPNGHPLTLKPTIALDDLDDLPFVWRHPCAAMAQLAEAMRQADIHCQVRARLRTIEYTQGLVAAGVGASLVPAWPEILANRSLSCRPLEALSIHQTIGIAYPEARLTPALEALIELGQAYWQERDQAG